MADGGYTTTMRRQRTSGISSPAIESSHIVELQNLLVGQPSPDSNVYLMVGDQRAPLTDTLINVLRTAMQHLSRGVAVEVLPIDRELSPAEGAALIGVSREYLRQAIHRGEIPAKRAGTHLRVALFDLHIFDANRRDRRSSLLSDLHEQSVELGGYDIDE